jgi:hypothetical protein
MEPRLDELPIVRVAHCGCVISASVPPVGITFKLTPTGDARVLIYACERHYQPLSEAVASEPVPVRKRARKDAAG